jgi:hypothetical protein
MFLKGAIGIIVALGLALAWQTFKVQGLEKAIVVAAVKQEAAEASLATAKQTAELVELQLATSQEKLEKIESERDNARVQVDKMRDIFQDHDFAKLITRKPGLIENRMIKKTEEVFNEIEALTSSQ